MLDWHNVCCFIIYETIKYSPGNLEILHIDRDAGVAFLCFRR